MVKRILDLLMASLLFLLLMPVLIALAFLIRWDSPGPALFRQDRVGRSGRDFQIWKFRTLKLGTPEQGPECVIAGTDPRITRVGRFLRKWSIDELPQLVNVLRGDMSLVGPRPTLRYQVEQYTPRQSRRLAVRPGMTGWAQIHGRNALSWPQRIEYDLWYVDHRSLWLDFRILVRTPMLLLGGRGLYGRKEDFAIRPDQGK